MDLAELQVMADNICQATMKNGAKVAVVRILRRRKSLPYHLAIVSGLVIAKLQATNKALAEQVLEGLAKAHEKEQKS